jgi:sensor c-di-GMP phosphodiesterase-like protein
LKIDKSFIQDSTTDPNDAALVETILAIAQHLHFKIVAEGVETQAQADFLNARANVIHQGYLYGRPEPVEKWLQQLDLRED